MLHIPSIGFLLITVSECCSGELPILCCPAGLLLPMGLGPVILRWGLFIAALARRCWQLGRGEGVGVICEGLELQRRRDGARHTHAMSSIRLQ